MVNVLESLRLCDYVEYIASYVTVYFNHRQPMTITTFSLIGLLASYMYCTSHHYSYSVIVLQWLLLQLPLRTTTVMSTSPVVRPTTVTHKSSYKSTSVIVKSTSVIVKSIFNYSCPTDVSYSCQINISYSCPNRRQLLMSIWHQLLMSNQHQLLMSNQHQLLMSNQHQLLMSNQHQLLMSNWCQLLMSNHPQLLMLNHLLNHLLAQLLSNPHPQLSSTQLLLNIPPIVLPMFFVTNKANKGDDELSDENHVGVMIGSIIGGFTVFDNPCLHRQCDCMAVWVSRIMWCLSDITWCNLYYWSTCNILHTASELLWRTCILELQWKLTKMMYILIVMEVAS